jgi:hypothetical protein
MDSLVTGLLAIGVVVFFVVAATIATQRQQSKPDEDD